MVKPTIDALTATAPQLGQAPAEFDANTDDFLPQLVPLQDQINVMIDWTDAQATAIAQTKQATEEDRTATGEDRTATGGDRTATGEDRTATGEDRTATGENLAAMRANYLGELAADPALDGNGDPVRDGAWYSNTTIPAPRLRRAGQWVTAVLDANGALMAANSLSDVPDKGAARTALELGSAATKDTGATEGKIPLLAAGGKIPAGMLPSGGVDYQEFTSSGTWTKPEGCSVVYIEAIGGGGGGGGTGSNGSSGGGGGGGGIAAILNASAVSQTVPVTIGGGCSGASTGEAKFGSDGGSTTFGSYAIAPGGQRGGGGYQSSIVGGNGGAGERGANFENKGGIAAGGYGSGGGATSNNSGGSSIMGGGGGGGGGGASQGGSSVFAGAGGGGNDDSNVKGGNGAYPGGGGGGSDSNGGGGDGADGRVRIWAW